MNRRHLETLIRVDEGLKAAVTLGVERDRRYEERFVAQEKAVETALQGAHSARTILVTVVIGVVTVAAAGVVALLQARHG